MPCAGVGVARLPLSLASRDLAKGTLVLWGEVDGPDIELWLLYPSRRRLSTRVAAFVDFFRETFPSGTPDELAAYANSCGGATPTCSVAGAMSEESERWVSPFIAPIFR